MAGLPGLSSSLLPSAVCLASKASCLPWICSDCACGRRIMSGVTTHRHFTGGSSSKLGRDIVLVTQPTHQSLPPPFCRLLQEYAHKRTSLQPLANVSLAGSAGAGRGGSPPGAAQQQEQQPAQQQAATQQHHQAAQQQPTQQPAQQLHHGRLEQAAGHTAAAEGASNGGGCVGGTRAAATAAARGAAAGAVGAAAAGAVPEGCDDGRQNMDVS